MRAQVVISAVERDDGLSRGLVLAVLGFLGRRETMAAVAAEVEKLRKIEDAWDVDVAAPPATWIADGHAHCKATVYSPEIIDAVQGSGELAPINLSANYLKAGGRLSQRLVVAAGLRLAKLLKAR